MKALRASLEATCRRLGVAPVEPLFLVSRDETALLSPIALKLGVDPHEFGMPVSAGLLVLETPPPVAGPLLGLEPRWEALFKMARALDPGPAEPTPQELQLRRYTTWCQSGLGSVSRLSQLLDEFYRTQDVLASAQRVALCRAALSTIATASAAE